MSYFVSTHQDQDHVLGFAELFHCGKPENWKKDEGKLLVDEIVCSKRSLSEESTDVSEAILKEIKRSNKLAGSNRDKDGNRLQIVGEGDNVAVATKLQGIENDLEIDSIEQSSRSMLVPLGTWHSHPNSTAKESTRDVSTYQNIINNSGQVLPFVMFIRGKDDLNLLIGINRTI